MHEMGGSCPFEAGRSGEQVKGGCLDMVPPYYGVHVNIVSCERLVFVVVFVFVFWGGDMGKSVGDDVSCSRSWGPWTEADSLQTARISHDFTWEKR